MAELEDSRPIGAQDLSWQVVLFATLKLKFKFC